MVEGGGGVLVGGIGILNGSEKLIGSSNVKAMLNECLPVRSAGTFQRKLPLFGVPISLSIGQCRRNRSIADTTW